jgi:hypothetical protein
MPMPRSKTLIAIVLIVVGIAGFAYQGIKLMNGATEPHGMPLPPVIGVLALIVGIALLLVVDGSSRSPRTDLHRRSS